MDHKSTIKFLSHSFVSSGSEFPHGALPNHLWIPLLQRHLNIDTYGTRTSSPGVVASVFGCSGFLGRNVVAKLCTDPSFLIISFVLRKL
jgi:hypothetical protein